MDAAPSYEIRIPASTSNLGAGFDCLGMALDLWLTIRVMPGAGTTVYTGTLVSLDPGTDFLTRDLADDALLDRHHLRVHSDIPLGRGLGSSAAARAGTAVLRRAMRNERVDRHAVFEEVADREGHPDNAAPATFGGAVLSVPEVDGTVTTARVPIHESVGVALAVPELHLETAAARERLPRTVARRRAVTQAARAAALVRGLETADPALLSVGMEDVIAVPARTDLIPGCQEARTAARDAGAWGATISGSGSALIALCPITERESVAAAMVTALLDADTPAHPLAPGISQEGFVLATP